MDEDVPFNVTVSTVTGRECLVSALASESVLELKNRVCEKLSVGRDTVYLLANEKELVDGTVRANNINKDSRLVVVPGVKSGLQITRNPQTVEFQALADKLLSFVTPEQMSAHLHEKKPVKLDINLPCGDGTNARIEVVVTPHAETNTATVTAEQRDDQRCAPNAVPEVLLWRRLSHISIACLTNRSLTALRSLAHITASVADMPIDKGLAAETVCAQHRLLDEVEKSLSVSDIGDDDGELRELQQLLCDVCKMLDKIKSAADKREATVSKSASVTAPCNRNVVDGKMKSSSHSRPARAVARENQAMHRKLLQLQKAMAERRCSKESSRLGKRRPVVVHAPPPVTGFGGLRRGFLLAKA